MPFLQLNNTNIESFDGRHDFVLHYFGILFGIDFAGSAAGRGLNNVAFGSILSSYEPNDNYSTFLGIGERSDVAGEFVLLAIVF